MPERPAPEPLGPRMPALRHGVAVLRLLGAHPGPLPAAAVARTLGIPRSSTYQILQVLVDEGLVVHIPEAQGYKLAIGVFELGSAYLRHEPLEHLARPLLLRVVAHSRQTVHLGVLSGHDSLYLLKEEPSRPTHLVTQVGLRLPAHLTATGRAILSHLPRAQVDAIYSTDRSWADWNGHGPRTLRELHALLAADRARGYAVEEDAITDGVTCLAAPVLDHTGVAVASVSSSFRTGTLPEAAVSALTAELCAAAHQLSRRLGGAEARVP